MSFNVPCSKEAERYPCEECGSFGSCKWTQKPKEAEKGMTLEQMQTHLDDSSKVGVFGLTWKQLEEKQGGKIKF